MRSNNDSNNKKINARKGVSADRIKGGGLGQAPTVTAGFRRVVPEQLSFSGGLWTDWPGCPSGRPLLCLW